MIEALDLSSNVPLYQQLFLALQESIASGEYTPGSKVPTEVELSKKYGVSRITVRNAIDELVKGGLLVKHQGKGTFVVENQRVKSDGVFSNFSSMCREEGKVPGAKVISINIVPSSDEEMEFFGPGSPKTNFQIKRVRTADGIPVALEKLIIPTSHTYILTSDLSGSFYEVLLENNLTPQRSRWDIDICKAGEDEHNYLGVAMHTALLLVKERLYGPGAAPIYLCQSTICSEAYHLIVF